MENRYLAKLTPIGKYYFGGENTFNTRDKANNSEVVNNYLVRSREYPQQTTLLGMLRFAILKQYGLLTKSRTEWKGKIGEKSFNGADPEITRWGIIESISALFLMNDTGKYVPAGFDRQFYNNEYDPAIELVPTILENVSSSYSDRSFHWLEKYNTKEKWIMLWKNAADDHIIGPSQIFAESFQVGITKAKKNIPTTDAFYKEFFYQLLDQFAFGFYVTTHEPLKNFDEPIVIQAGGDQSLFQLRISEASDNIFEQKEINGPGKFTLLSDTYCKAEDVLPLCSFCITQSVDFRYMQTSTIQTERFYNVSERAKDMRKSKKLNLLERGSILYTNNARKLQEMLKENSYVNAGFNRFRFTPFKTDTI